MGAWCTRWMALSRCAGGLRGLLSRYSCKPLNFNDLDLSIAHVGTIILAAGANIHDHCDIRFFNMGFLDQTESVKKIGGSVRTLPGDNDAKVPARI